MGTHHDCTTFEVLGRLCVVVPTAAPLLRLLRPVGYRIREHLPALSWPRFLLLTLQETKGKGNVGMCVSYQAHALNSDGIY